jgi:hypothetical protein
MVRLTGRPNRYAARRVQDQPRNYFSRQEQYRLLMLVSMLMLALVLMVEAARPRNWQWLWNVAGGPNPAVSQPGASRVGLVHDDPPIDTRLPPRPRPAGDDVPGQFVAQWDRPSQHPPEPSTAAGDYFPGVSPQLLADVRDDTVFRPAEADAWFHLFQVLARSDPARLEAASLGTVGFVPLYKQTNAYRGRLVTVQGTVRRAHPLSAPPNAYGISGYWMCWLQPAGGPDAPIVVYTLEMPTGFPSGMELREAAAFTGFFYKRWAYEAREGTLTAPLVLARTGRWTPATAEGPPQPPPAGRFALVMMGAAALGVVIALLVYRASRARGASAHAPVARAPADELDALRDAPVLPDVRQRLREMAEQADAEERAADTQFPPG